MWDVDPVRMTMRREEERPLIEGRGTLMAKDPVWVTVVLSCRVKRTCGSNGRRGR